MYYSSRFQMPFWFALAVFVLAFADVQKFSAALVLVVLPRFTLPALARTTSLCAAFERERDWYAA